MSMVSMAQVLERKNVNPNVQGSHLTPPQHFEVVCFWAWFNFNKNFLSNVRECDGENGRAVNLKTQGSRFYLHMGQILVFFKKNFHSHIHKI